MGRATHLPPSSAFARVLNEYLANLVNEAGGDVLSGRWLEKRTAEQREDAPKRSYWAKFTKNEQAMTTNDIALLAPIFGMTPYEFVASAREWGEGVSNVTPIRPNVGPHAEDYELSEYPADLPAVAEEERKPDDD